MLTASRILGDQVGSTAPVFLAFLCVHVIAGLTAGSWSVVAGRQRREYRLTSAGSRALSGKRADWQDFAAMISAALEGRPCPRPA